MQILYMNSFSRSGETLMLRTLQVHKDVEVLHQLYKLADEDKKLYDVFKIIKHELPNEVSQIEHDPLPFERNKFLVVKNATFENSESHKGFILVRNPFSTYMSYKKLASKLKDDRKQMRNWARAIDPLLLKTVNSGSFLEAFTALYVRKMGALTYIKQPIIRYEDFVKNPENQLYSLLSALDIPWDENVLKAHEFFEENLKGHGGINLSKPITNQFNPDISSLTNEEIIYIYNSCSSILRYYGYGLSENLKEVVINKLV